MRDDTKTRAADRPRHPDFDAMWGEHEMLVRWVAYRIFKTQRITSSDTIGTLVIIFNQILYTYSPARGKFSTYFTKLAPRLVRRYFSRFESQRESVASAHSATPQRKRERRPAVVPLTEPVRRALGAPRIEPSGLEQLETEIGPGGLWELLTQGLSATENFILWRRVGEGAKLREISEELHVTRERVRQIQMAAMAKLRDWLGGDPTLRELFGRESWPK